MFLGYHLWGFDLRSDDTPHESGLGFVCRKNGDFKGKQAVDRQRLEGVNKKLVYLTVDEHVPLFGLEGVYRNGEPVGHLRRAEFAFCLDKLVGKSYIRRNDGKPVDANYLKSGYYEIDVMGKKYEATCHAKSPFDPDNQRLHGNYFSK